MGGGVPDPLFPLNKLTCSPVPQKSKICFLMFSVPQYCLCFLFTSKFGLSSPVPLKFMPFSSVPKTSWRASKMAFMVELRIDKRTKKMLGITPSQKSCVK